MIEFSHFYSKYGQALLYEDQVEDYNEKAKELLEIGLENFRLTAGHFEGEEQVKYNYTKIKKGNPSKGVFLAPSVTTTDRRATGLWSQIEKLRTKLDSSDLDDKETIKQSCAPMSGEYNNGRSRHTPKSTLEEAVCCAITTTSIYKPCISFRTDGKYNNYSIIPDLPVNELQKFISLFKRMLISDTSKSLFVGKVKDNKPKRPEIYYGNFPNPPKSSYLAIIGVIAAMAEWAKEANLTTWANEVLESLKGATLYLVTYGDAKPFTYNHYVIDLAKDRELREIIDSIYYTELFGKNRWNYSSKEDQTEYKKFDLFASQFLQLFNKPAFKDFLAFRAEYPYQLKILFKTYFTKMENIDIKIVKSANALGRWLNYAAYKAAIAENDNTKSDDFKKAKSKALVELESAAFSAKSGDALIAQVVTRAGRISGIDAPSEATLFMEKASSGSIDLENAKNLVMAFSRLKYNYEPQSNDEGETDDKDVVDTSEFNEE